MVLAGQYLERSAVVGGLDALYHRGTREPPCAIAAPHPALGGSMVSPVVAELAWALTRAGHPTLRFDYRGVGASRGASRHPAGAMRIADLQDEVADLHAICEHLIATTQMPAVCAVGYSFGAAVALEAAQDARIGRLGVVAPPGRTLPLPPGCRPGESRSWWSARTTIRSAIGAGCRFPAAPDSKSS